MFLFFCKMNYAHIEYFANNFLVLNMNLFPIIILVLIDNYHSSGWKSGGMYYDFSDFISLSLQNFMVIPCLSLEDSTCKHLFCREGMQIQ